MKTAAAAHEQIAMQMHHQQLRQAEMRRDEMRQAEMRQVEMRQAERQADILRRQHRFLQVNITIWFSRPKSISLCQKNLMKLT